MDGAGIAAGALEFRQRSGRRSIVPRLLLAAGIVALVGIGNATAAPKTGLFATHRVSAKATLPVHAKPGTAVVGRLDPAAVKAAKLEVPLPDGRILDVAQDHVSRDDRTGTSTWTGSVAGSPGSRVVLARHKGMVAGFVQLGSRTYEIHATPVGEALLFEVVSPPLVPGDAIPVPLDTVSGRAKVGTGAVGRLSADLSPVFQDLLVVYTPAALAARGPETLESMALAAVAGANASYRQSGVNLTVSLVGLQAVAITEGPTSQETLNALRTNADVAALRNHVGADLVLLVTGATDNWCGYAYIMGSNGPQFAPFAFGVVRSACLGGNTLTHELGHIQGLAHDRETGGSAGAYPYARGYRRCTADGSAFHDIMAYSCGASFPLTTFSSAGIFHQGHPTGVAYELDAVNAADGARALSETAATVAGFRASVATPPIAPVALTGTTLAFGEVNLSWEYGAVGAAGFKIERTTDGVNYVEVANVVAPGRDHQDRTVAPDTTYSYRVAAYNSAGLSPYSNVATVTTPPEAPRAPSGLQATAVSSGEVRLAWVDNSSNEAGFRIERSRNGASYAEIASLGADVQAYTDRSVASDTTYDYRVAAYNAGGASGYSPRATARTPVAPPQLPIEFSVTNNRKKTALVRFTPSPGAPVANYELVREIFKKKQWRYPTTLFSIQAHAPHTSVDASGKGTFRYSIRACNAAGCTAYSAPVTVKVTK